MCYCTITKYTGWSEKTSQTLRNFEGAYTLWGEPLAHLYISMYYYLLINFSDVVNECRIMT